MKRLRNALKRDKAHQLPLQPENTRHSGQFSFKGSTELSEPDVEISNADPTPSSALRPPHVTEAVPLSLNVNQGRSSNGPSLQEETSSPIEIRLPSTSRWSVPNQQETNVPFGSLESRCSAGNARLPDEDLIGTPSEAERKEGTTPPYFTQGVDSQADVKELKRRKRRESHNVVERRRRDNINDGIRDLSNLLPQYHRNDSSKQAIIEATVNWTRDLMWSIRLKGQREAELQKTIQDLGGSPLLPDIVDTVEESIIDQEVDLALANNDINSFSLTKRSTDGRRSPLHARRASEPLQVHATYNAKPQNNRTPRHLHKVSSRGSIISYVASVHSVTSLTYRSPSGDIETERHELQSNFSYPPKVTSVFDDGTENGIGISDQKIFNKNLEPFNRTTSPPVTESGVFKSPYMMWPPPEKREKPLKFKDAVGRKFSFPYHLCNTWKGMEDLIKAAFEHVESVGPHVMEGHYDLFDQQGEIILPQVWETLVRPDWTVTMHMWPTLESESRAKDQSFKSSVLEKTIPGAGDRPRKRHRHTTSRAGCRTCKRRHIRCDERFPQCQNCIKHSCRCDYQDSVSRSPRGGEAIAYEQDKVIGPDASQANFHTQDSDRGILAIESTNPVGRKTEAERPDSKRLNSGNFSDQGGEKDSTASRAEYSAEYLENGHVRLKWKCTCNHPFQIDVLERQAGAAMAAVQELSYYNADTEEDIEIQYPRPILATLSERISKVFRLSGGSIEVLPHSWSMQTGSEDDVKLRREAPTPGPDRYICVCFPGITYKKYLHHVDVNRAADDPQLFLALQRKYYDWKPLWRRVITLRSLSRVEYFEFRVFFSNLVTIKDDWRDRFPQDHGPDEWSYTPTSRDMTPYLIDDVLTHYVHNPQCAKLGNYFWKRIPKKMFCQLECPDDKPFKVGWGLYFIEDFSQFYLMLVLVPVLVGGVAVAAWYCARYGKSFADGATVASGFAALVMYMFSVAQGWAKQKGSL